MRITRLDDERFDWRSGAGGADSVRRVTDAAAAHDGRDPLNEAARLALARPGRAAGLLLLAEDTEQTEDAEQTEPAEPAEPAAGDAAAGRDHGAAAGFAFVHHPAGPTTAELELVVAPSARRRGVAAALVTAVGQLVPEGPLTAWSHGNHPGAARLAARTGFTAVRGLWLMRRPTSAATEDMPAPRGTTVRTFRPGEDDAAFLRLNAEAFAAHPEQAALDQVGLEDRMQQSWFDAAGFLVAEPSDASQAPDGPGGGPGDRPGQLVGFHWTKVHPGTDSSAPAGEVYVLGVAPAAQGTGLAKHLLHLGLRHLHERGVAEVLLYVEADNIAAIRLYQRAGFTHAAADTDVMYAR